MPSPPRSFIVGNNGMACGLVGLPGLIGFGSPQQALTVLGGTIDTSGLANYAFSMPREGVITALAGYMSATAGASLDTTLTVRMQLYQSTTPDNIFSPIPGVGVTFSATTLLTVGETFNDIVTGLSVQVLPQTRLLLVVSAQGGFALGGTVTGYYSAGLEIV